jgi:hypothetical protein
MAQSLLVHGVAAVALAVVVLALGQGARRRDAGPLARATVVAGVGAAVVSLVQCALGLWLAGWAVPDGDTGRAGALFATINRLDGVKMLALAPWRPGGGRRCAGTPDPLRDRLPAAEQHPGAGGVRLGTAAAGLGDRHRHLARETSGAARRGVDVARVEVVGHQLRVQIEDMDKLWSLKGRLEVPLTHVTGAEADPEAVRGWKGWRGPGTHVPAIVVAGTFHTLRGKAAFDGEIESDAAVGSPTLLQFVLPRRQDSRRYQAGPRPCAEATVPRPLGDVADAAPMTNYSYQVANDSGRPGGEMGADRDDTGDPRRDPRQRDQARRTVDRAARSWDGGGRRDARADR